MKNLIRRYARCKRFDKLGGCNFFEWVDDSLCHIVKSNVVALMVQNETLLAENEEMMKQLKEWETDKENLSRMKQKNFSLKMEVKAYYDRERSVIWAMLIFLPYCVHSSVFIFDLPLLVVDLVYGVDFDETCFYVQII